MKKHTIKRLCGVAGLLAVGAMTAAAFNMPGPEVQAVESSASTTVTVKVVESPIKIWHESNANNNDPIIKTQFPDEVCRVTYQATHLTEGGDLFVEPFSVTIPTPRPTDSLIYPVLPFEDNGATTDDYNIVATGYSCDQPDLVIGTAMLRLSYSGPAVPKTGNTGELNILGVNLARADFIAIGLLILAAAIVCIVLAVRKKNHPTPKRR